jgi:hypothetical protein
VWLKAIRAKDAQEIDAQDRANASRQGDRTDLVYTNENDVHEVERPSGNSSAAFIRRAYRRMSGLLDQANAAGEPWQAAEVIRVIALTGCRRGEIEWPQRSEVDLVRQVLRLGDTKTGRSIRPIGAEAVAA